MELGIIVGCIILLSLSDYIYIRRKDVVLENKKVKIAGLLPTGWKQVVCYLMIPFSLICIALMMNSFYEMPIIYSLKRICVISVLWPIAISDYQEFRIPNKLILFGIGLRLPLLIAEIVLHGDTVLATVINELCAVVGAVVVCIICMLLARGSMGMGDLKLLTFMAAFLGVEGICYAMFVSIFFSAVISIGLLIFKKKSRKDKIPFAPFILAGTFVCLILTGV